MTRLSPSLARLFPALLFFSGYCGISYEVLYARWLGDLVGDQFAVVASVLLTFLLGIGVGTLVAHALWRYLWLIEAGIGLYAVGLMLAQGPLAELLYRRLPGIGLGPGSSMVVAVVVLTAPAFLIGAGLPLFAGYLRVLAPRRSFSAAYGLYNLGAAATALLIEFFLLRHLGLRWTTLLVAAINGAVAVLLVTAFRDVRGRVPPRQAGTPILSSTLVALALASLASAVFQLLGVKLVESVIGPFHETFAVVLAVVFVGQAAGSALVATRRLTFERCMLLVLAGVLGLLGGLKALAFGYAWLYPMAAERYSTAVLLKLGFAAVALGVPLLGFGATIPALLRTDDNVARDAGRLLCVSSVANAAGFLLMAFVLMRHVDFGPTLVLIAAVAGMALVVAEFATRRPGRVRAVEFAGALALVGLVLLAGRTAWNEGFLYLGHTEFHSTSELRRALGAQRHVQAFKAYQDVFAINWVAGRPYFFINGFVSFSLDGYNEPLAGALAAMVAPRTDRAMVLGLGSGSTAAVLAMSFDRLDAVEINPLVVENLHRLAAWNFRLHELPNVRIVVDDGMHALRRPGTRYTLIVNTVNTPLYFSASKLYSLDFLRAARARLTDDGVYVTWIDSRVGDQGVDIMLRTLTDVFSDCGFAGITGNYLLLMCSAQPLRLYRPRIIAEQAELADFFLLRHGIVPEWIPYAFLGAPARAVIEDPRGPRNTLDRPVLEFEMARLRQRGITEFKRRLRARVTLASQEAFLSPAMAWKPEELVQHAEAYLGDSTLTDHWNALTRNLPDFAARRRQASEWYWRRNEAALRTPKDRWLFAARLAEAGSCDRAASEFARVTHDAPTLPRPGALTACQARATP
jgi:predicted membrane-bound spermidine synthase